MAVTLSDVARRAGVSEATASRVLNGRRYVAVATRERVEQAAIDLDYVPNQAARDLSTARTTTVALLVHHAQYPAHGEGTFSSRVVDGISRALRVAGHDLLYVPVDDAGARNLARIASIRPGRADGIVVLGPAFPRSALRELVDTGRPMIVVDNRLPDVDAVLADNRVAMRALATHLAVDHGHGRLVCLAGPASWPSTVERLAGVRDAAAEVGAEVTVLRARETTMRDGAMLAAGLARDRFDAVVAVNDAMAIGALHRLRVTGHALPVTGFDDIAWAAITEPPLTTVTVDAGTIGIEAARRLLARLASSTATPMPPREIRVAATLRLRRSCGCAEQPNYPEAMNER
jgi:DNA-binding LacI/PurR family transcriptional regulator